MPKQEFISYWMVGIAALILAIIGLLIPLIPGFLSPIIAVIFVIYAKRKNWMKKFSLMTDGSILVLSFFMSLLIVGALGLFSLESVPWTRLIIVGVIASVVSFLGDWIPVVGSIISAIITFLASIFIIGGIQGVMIGAIIALISLIPLPFAVGILNFLFIPLALLIFKIISIFITSSIRGIFLW